MTKILIIGAAGNVASRIVAGLSQEADVSLRLTSSRKEGVDKLQAAYPQAQVMHADWYDVQSLHRAFEGMNRIVVIPPDFVTDEEKATPNIIAAAKASPTVDLVVRMLANSQTDSADDLDPEYRAIKVGSSLHTVAQGIYAKSDIPVAFVNACGWFFNNLSWMVASDVKEHKKVILPHDASRFWLNEDDLASVFIKVLLEGPEKHVGKNHIITGIGRYRFSDIATIISAETDKNVQYEDSDAGIKSWAGDQAETLIQYMKHESKIWDAAHASSDFYKLMGYHPETLQSFIHKKRDWFI